MRSSNATQTKIISDLRSENSKLKDDLERCSSPGEIPKYGPARGDRCLNHRDDATGKYTLYRSFESHNVIENECSRTTGNVQRLRYILTAVQK